MTRPNLVSAIYDLHAKGIRLSPCHSNRASQIGDPCERSLVYRRIAWDKAERPTIERQLNFDEGNLHEGAVMVDLQKAGVKVIEQQISFIDRQTNITAHLDAVVEVDDVMFPLEFKSCSPFIYDALAKYGPEDYLKAMEQLGELYPWLKKYPAQVLIYCFFKALPTGIIIFKNKANGRLLQFFVDLEPNIGYLDQVFEKAKRVNQFVGKFFGPSGEMLVPAEAKEAEALLPARLNDRDECRGCDFKGLCLPDIDFGAPLQIKDDPGFEAKVDRFFLFENFAKQYDDLNDTLKEQCRGVENLILGKFHITGKADAKGAWRKKIVFIDDADRASILEQAKHLQEIIERKGKKVNA